jgi:rubrerythrin
MADNFLSRVLGARFLDRLAASPRGRGFLLAFLVGAEQADEIGVFDRLLAEVDDPDLHTLVRRHRDDELRHAEVFRGCLARQPIVDADLPAPIGVVPFIDAEAGGIGSEFVGGRRGVMDAYVLLQVIEERGVQQYPLIANAIEPFDRETADVIRQVAHDETRHVKYAIAIAQRYAPDPQTYADTLARFRTAEQRAFVAHGQAFLAQAVAADLLEVGRVERVAWRALVALGRRAPLAARPPRFASAR